MSKRPSRSGASMAMIAPPIDRKRMVRPLALRDSAAAGRATRIRTPSPSLPSRPPPGSLPRQQILVARRRPRGGGGAAGRERRPPPRLRRAVVHDVGARGARLVAARGPAPARARARRERVRARRRDAVTRARRARGTVSAGPRPAPSVGPVRGLHFPRREVSSGRRTVGPGVQVPRPDPDARRIMLVVRIVRSPPRRPVSIPPHRGSPPSDHGSRVHHRRPGADRS